MNLKTVIRIKNSIAFLTSWHDDIRDDFDLIDLVEKKLTKD